MDPEPDDVPLIVIAPTREQTRNAVSPVPAMMCAATVVAIVWGTMLVLSIPKADPALPAQPHGACAGLTIASGNYSGVANEASSSILHNARISLEGSIDEAVFVGKVVSKYGQENITSAKRTLIAVDPATCAVSFAPKLDLPGGVESFSAIYVVESRCFDWRAATLVGVVGGPFCKLK